MTAPTAIRTTEATRRLAERSRATGSAGAVAAGSGAAAIGLTALLQGGSAVDAALAAALAETVLLPSKAGLGGDLVALVCPAGGAAPRVVSAIGPAPEALRGYAEASSWQVGPTGATAVGVPGAPAGYAALAEHARLPLAELAAPAIALARRGFSWSPLNARLAGEAAALLRTHQPDGCCYLPASGPHPVGARVRLPGLARVLEEFVHRGTRLFDGPLGDAVLARVARAGGVLTADDLRVVAPRAAEQLDATITDLGAGRRLWTTPAPTYGTALRAALVAVAEGVPVRAAVRAALAEMRCGHTPALRDGTSAVAALDTDGTAVVLVHSNSFPQFGSGLVVDGYDLVLANRAGRGFTWDPGHPNSPAIGRRPRTTLHAWALGGSAPHLLGATPGGEQQVPWNAQLLAELIDGAQPGDTLLQPRWELDAAGEVVIEGEQLPELGARSSHVMVGHEPSGLCSAWADPRLDGGAVAA